MKFTEIYYLERKNKGNYEHEELSCKALIDEDEDKFAAMLTLKDLVHNALYGIGNKPIAVEESRNTPAEVEVVEAPKKTRAKKVADVSQAQASTEEVVKENINQSAPIEVVEEKKKAVKLVKYSSAIPEHKSIFGGYLAKKYQDTWKTKDTSENIKAFTASLNGQDFLDDAGAIVPTFLELVHTFFGMPA